MLKWLGTILNYVNVAGYTIVNSQQQFDVALQNQYVLNHMADIAVYPAQQAPYPMPEGLELLAIVNGGNETANQMAFVGRKHQYDLLEKFQPVDARQQYGKVTLVGAGPGNPDLLTIKALKCIKNADIIYHDHLLNPTILEVTNAEKVFVGKKSKKHFRKQDETNALMLQSAKEGKNVVRLKGGDPFVFGRGGEELDYLQQRFIHVDVVPGITSAAGASASAVLPLTYREVSASVAFLTGYPKDKIGFPDADTLVYYMAASNIHYIANELIARGRKPDTPAAIVENATYHNQSTTFTNLTELANEQVKAVSPSVIIIGDVVKNRNISAARKPLVLVTGTSAKAYSHLGHVVHKPLIRLNPVDVTEFQQPWLENNHQYMVFTSRYTVHFFFQNLNKIGFDARWMAGKTIISIGRVTTSALKEHGLTPDIQVWPESTTGLINWFRKNTKANDQVLLPRSDTSLSTLLNNLQEIGLKVDCPIVYRNTMPENAEKTELAHFQMVVFTSPSTVKNFMKLYGHIPAHLKIVSRGEQTYRQLVKLGINEEQFIEAHYVHQHKQNKRYKTKE